MSLNHALIVLVLKLYWFTNQDNGIEITGNYWRLLEITGDYLVLLEITGDYLVFLSQSYTLLQLLLLTELREGISTCVIPARGLGPPRQPLTRAIPFMLVEVLPVLEVLLRSLGYRWKDKKVVYVVDTPRQ